MTVGGTENARAREAFLLGRFFWNKRTPEAYTQAIERFDQAIALDPNYAEAYAGLADAYAALASVVEMSDRRHERMRIAKEKAQQALRIDERVAEAHATLGYIAWHYDWDWDVSERELRRAIELKPDYATAHQWYAILLVSLGRRDEAVARINRARELDPLSLIINNDVSEILLEARRYDEAIEQARRTIDMDPNHLAARHARDILAFCFYFKGMYREAIAELERQVAHSNREAGALRWLAAFYFRLGHENEGQSILDELRRRGESTEIDRYWAFREIDAKFAESERDFEYRQGGLIHLNAHPYYDDLRADPRFADLVRRVGLPQ